MKYITIILLLVAITGRGQGIDPSIYDPQIINPLHDKGIKCGTWVPLPEQIVEWATVDTLGKKKITDTVKRWVYDKEFIQPETAWAEALYQPCGSGTPTIYLQYRICALTGIRQVRKRIFPYQYIEPVPSEYERIIDSLTQDLAPPYFRSQSMDTATIAWHGPHTLQVGTDSTIPLTDVPHLVKKRKIKAVTSASKKKSNETVR
jgi:hypothetical protein